MSSAIVFQAAQATPFMTRVRSQKPLIHCITNQVVQNFTANILLAIGASPAMVIAREEVQSFVTVANSLLINIGTVYQATSESMLLAAQQARESNVPWVLDPVAVGTVLPFRTRIAHELLAFRPDVIRANAAEILTLAGEQSSAKGTDSQDSTEAALDSALRLAEQYQTIVAVTGETDYITDGKTIYTIKGGDVALTRVTGTGCSLSAMVAALIAGAEDKLLATATACYMMKKAAELANKQFGLGTFAVSLLDQLSLLPANVSQGE